MEISIYSILVGLTRLGNFSR